MKSILFTKQGFEDFKIKLDLEIQKRPQAVKTLTRAREMGDLSENGLYKAARFELSDIDRQIRYLKNLIKYGVISAPNDNKSVQFGHQVTIENENGKKQFQIVGEYEANPKENKISYKSPLGHNLLGKSINDTLNLTTPGGITYYKIIGIAN